MLKIPLPSNKILFKYHGIGEVVPQARALNTLLKLIPSESLRQSIINYFLQERQSQSMILVAVVFPLPLLLHSLILNNAMSNKSNTQLLPSVLQLILTIIIIKVIIFIKVII